MGVIVHLTFPPSSLHRRITACAKSIFLTMLILIGAGTSTAWSEVGQGKRDLRVYNITIYDFPLITTDRSSTLTYLAALNVTPAVYAYLRDVDATRDSINLYGSNAAARLDTGAAVLRPFDLDYMESKMPQEPSPIFSTYGPGAWYPDYYIAQSVYPQQPAGSKKFILTISLMTAGREVVATGQTELAYYPLGNVGRAVNALMSQFIGPVYRKIREFEIKKRDSGAVYAAHPVLVCTSDKRSLAFGETTPLRFSLKDGDGTPLKNRTIVIDTCLLGTTDKQSVTTDEKGGAIVLFTADGAAAGIAAVKYSFTYTEPWAKREDKTAYTSDAFMEINRPADMFWVRIDYTLTGSAYSTRAESNTYSSAGSSRKIVHTQMCGWVRNAYLPQPADRCFAASIRPAVARSAGYQSTKGEWFTLSTAAEFIRSKEQFLLSAIAQPSIVPSIDLVITPQDFYVSTVVSGRQNGIASFMQEKNSNASAGSALYAVTPAIGETLRGTGRDTSYVNATDDGVASRRESVAQTVAWSGPSMVMTYAQDVAAVLRKDSARIMHDSVSLQGIRMTIEVQRNSLTAAANETTDPSVPTAFALRQNYPNPFNPSTTIAFSLPSRSAASLTISDVLGRVVAVLVHDDLPAGTYSRQWDASNMASGVYFCRLQAGAQTQVRRLVLLR